MRKKIKPAAWLYYLSRNLLHIFLRSKMPITITGREHIPKDGGLLLASNHASYLDPPFVSIAARNRFVRYMARDTLFSSTLSNWFFHKTGVMPLDRNKGDIAALKTSIQMLKEGDCVGIFPEGTRTEDGKLQEAKGGIGFLISKGGVPVVPMFIDGTYEAYPKGAKKIGSANITINIGKAISLEELDIRLENGKPDYQKIGQLVMQRIADLKPSAG